MVQLSWHFILTATESFKICSTLAHKNTIDAQDDRRHNLLEMALRHTRGLGLCKPHRPLKWKEIQWT